VVARLKGREKLHDLNRVPIRLIHDRRIDKYTERPSRGLMLPISAGHAARATDSSSGSTDTCVTGCHR
jgi:hypothetical protein